MGLKGMNSKLVATFEIDPRLTTVILVLVFAQRAVFDAITVVRSGDADQLSIGTIQLAGEFVFIASWEGQQERSV